MMPMSIGERIRFFRILRGMTQKGLGITLGFRAENADIRMSQYESGIRTPKGNIIYDLAQALDVSPKALAVPSVRNDIELMHFLFALEDYCGLQILNIEGELCMRFAKSQSRACNEMICAWNKQVEKLEANQISREEYDNWRYNFPKLKNI